MRNGQTDGALIAVVGKREALLPLLSAEFPEAAVFDERTRYYPYLSIRDNVRQLRMMVGEGDAAFLEKLLELSGLSRLSGWTRPFRKDMTGELRLFGILEAMLTRPDTLIGYDLLAGMTAKQRERFAEMAAYYRDSGGRLVYTAQSLKDVQQPELTQELRVLGTEAGEA